MLSFSRIFDFSFAMVQPSKVILIRTRGLRYNKVPDEITPHITPYPKTVLNGYDNKTTKLFFGILIFYTAVPKLEVPWAVTSAYLDNCS